MDFKTMKIHPQTKTRRYWE